MVGKKSERRAESKGSTEQGWEGRRTRKEQTEREKEITDKNILRLRTEERCQITWVDKEA